MAIKFRDRADCIIDPNGCARIVRNPDLGKPDAVHAVKIGLNKTVENTKLQIEVPVFVILDRCCGIAKEEHIARFNPKEWDAIALKTDSGSCVTLKDALIVYDDESPKKFTSNEAHLDFAGGMEGVDVGVSKEYYSGWVRDIHEVVVSSEVFHLDKETALAYALPTFRKLELERQEKYRLADNSDDCLDEPDPPISDDYEPKLSDFYDDMEELELNTRGDGFD